MLLWSWPSAAPIQVVGPLSSQPDGAEGVENAPGCVHISVHEGLALFAVLELADGGAALGQSCRRVKGVGAEVALSIVALDMPRASVRDVREEGGQEGVIKMVIEGAVQGGSR